MSDGWTDIRWNIFGPDIHICETTSKGALVLNSVTILAPSLPTGLYSSWIPSEKSEKIQLVMLWRENLYTSMDHKPSRDVG
jgi:hypothetical protein